MRGLREARLRAALVPLGRLAAFSSSKCHTAQSFIQLFIYIGRGFIGEETLGTSKLEQMCVNLIGEKPFARPPRHCPAVCRGPAIIYCNIMLVHLSLSLSLSLYKQIIYIYTHMCIYIYIYQCILFIIYYIIS